MEKNLELRMYFFTIYQLTGIQAGIQCGHAALEYAYQFGKTKLFKDFASKWKTWIILNGGTTNKGRDLDGICKGTLDQIGDQLMEKNIQFSFFHEPDLNESLTALCFICDERVWDTENYPDFIDYLCQVKNFGIQESIAARAMYYPDLLREYSDVYEDWLEMIGGSENKFLRDLIRDKRLA